MSQPNTVYVVAAAIEHQGKVLIAKRHEHLHQGGLWEFPGGKRENNEGIEQALARELQEELNITPTKYDPLIKIHYAYPDKNVFLDVWRVNEYSGNPAGNEGQQILWVDIEKLKDFDFPAANRGIIAALQLPEVYVITPEPNLEELDSFIATLQKKLQQGYSLFQLRAKNLSTQRLLDLYDRCKEITDLSGASLYLNCDPVTATKLNIDKVHLASKYLRSVPKHFCANRQVAASCHNEDEIRLANACGAEFIVLSPVCKTASHPEKTELGWPNFATLCSISQSPVFALGGLNERDIELAQLNGAQGVSGISGFWESKKNLQPQ